MITEEQNNDIGKLQNFITPLHQLSKREYLPRMNDDKVHCMTVAKQYGADYWDGDRRYGYGGYFYRPGYWTPVAQNLIDTYNLKPGSKVLDIGCGKGFLLHELLLLEPQLQVLGTDISQYAISQATELVKPLLKIHDTRGKFLCNDKEFDPEKTMRMAYKQCHRSAELLTEAGGYDVRWLDWQDPITGVVGYFKEAENG